MWLAAHDQHRAVRVMHAVLADRAEQRIGERPVAAAADDEQVRAGRGVQQDLRRMAVDDWLRTSSLSAGSTSSPITASIIFLTSCLKSPASST
jgi:hypothetical protein